MIITLFGIETGALCKSTCNFIDPSNCEINDKYSVMNFQLYELLLHNKPWLEDFKHLVDSV